MELPNHLKYTATHEWIAADEDGVVTVGITDFAQSQLGDIVYIEPPQIGQALKKGEEAGVVESVKAASDIYAPVGGEVIAVNEDLKQTPEALNQDPYQQGWLFKLKIHDPAELADLLDADRYSNVLAEHS